MSEVDHKPTSVTEEDMIPQIVREIADRSVYPHTFDVSDGVTMYVHGLTKRELFAAMAMQAVRAINPTVSSETAAKDAVLDADALLKELAK